MNIKSLLWGVTMLSVSGVAQAFPEYELNPEDGKTFDNRQSLAMFNIIFGYGDEVTVTEGAVASLESEEGDEVFSTSFAYNADFGMTLINFDAEEIVINGVWSFTIPAGSLKVNGEENPEITATYTLNDPTIGIGEFPQITLVSIDPAEGTEIPVWGGEDFTRVNIKTSDDSAVNYIEWFLYDITNGVDEYIRQGNDNRYDVNRYGDDKDHWADGLFISVSGDERLILGHTYRLDLRFCGIGYDVKTNQYPNPDQIELSTELQCSVTYKGKTPPQEYSESEYVSVSPDPEEYKITNPDFAQFTITYSGPAKPVEFNYSLGFEGTAPAGTYAPADGEELDQDGCAKAWTFTFDKSVVETSTGTIFVTVVSQDKDGLYVKGNGGMHFDDITYSISWMCNCGATALTSVSPANLEEVEELSSITISNEMNYPMNLSYQTSEKVEIRSLDGAVVRTLSDPEYSEDLSQATWNFEAITEPGTYVLLIPDMYFIVGEEYSSTISNATEFTYYVKGNQQGGGYYDVLPKTITPADNEILSSISRVSIEFDKVMFMPIDGTQLAGSLYKVSDSGEEVLIEEVQPTDLRNVDWFNPTLYDYDFKEVVEPGSYKVVIPAGTYFDESYDMTGEGHLNPEIIVNYKISVTGVDSVIGADATVDVYSLQGVVVLRGADAAAVKALPAGLYIINGKKVMVRK